MKIKRGRDFPLAIKLWGVITCIIIPCILLLSTAFKFVLDYTRDETIYASIQKAQQLLKEDELQGPPERSTDIVPPDYDAIVSVYHIGIVDRQVRYMTFPASKFTGLSTQFINIMCTSYSEQTALLKKYKVETTGYNLYYVIAKTATDGVISFRADSANGGIYNRAMLLIAAFSGAAMLLTLLIAFLFSRSVVKPLKKLETAAARMAAGDFLTPVAVDRNDEVGRLSAAIDQAREELKQRDFFRQSAIQYVSHELKTPVMTIGSYAQSILDKIYPRGDLESSVKVIASQAARLQGIILKLLTLTRLDYLDERPKAPQRLDLAEIVEEVSSRVLISRPEINVQFDLNNAVIDGVQESIEVMVENLLENAMRYAASAVRVSVEQKDGQTVLAIFNDGGPIDKDLLPTLFDPFKKGKRGVTGLGLAIVKRTADSCGAQVLVENTAQGALFTVVFGAHGSASFMT